METIIKLVAIGTAAAIWLAAAAPAIAAGDEITAPQKSVAEQFISALMKSDYKQAYLLFSPQVRGRYPFGIFTEIQDNIAMTIGTPASFTWRTGRPEAPSTCIYDVIYARGATRTAIPLRLTFAASDPDGKLGSFTYLKDQMRELKN